MIIPVILSGGAGTRLWPVSRAGHPKPFMKLADGEMLVLAADHLIQDQSGFIAALIEHNNRSLHVSHAPRIF